MEADDGQIPIFGKRLSLSTLRRLRLGVGAREGARRRKRTRRTTKVVRRAPEIFTIRRSRERRHKLEFVLFLSRRGGLDNRRREGPGRVGSGSRAAIRLRFFYCFGTLWPLAAKALPKSFLGPPPAGFT